MAALQVLVVGGGFTGSVLATALAQRGVAVELVEIADEWRGIGHGITFQGNALRALRAIGVTDEVIAAGYPFEALRLLRADGGLIQEIRTPPLGGPGLPPTMGALRGELQTILATAARAAGVHVRLGVGPSVIEQSTGRADVTFTDGTTGSYDLVVGADGINSTVRGMIGIEESPAPVGMAIWRIEGPRPEAMTCAEVYYQGPRYKAGYTPISQERMYAYLLDEDIHRPQDADPPLWQVMKERGAGYGGTWGEVRDRIGPDTYLDYRSLEWLLVPAPWYRGRAIIIGDAAHACPPLIAQGAAQGVEDAVVLAEILTGTDDVDVALKQFMERRMPRARLVVENSMLLARWEIDPSTPGADPGGLMARSLAALTTLP